MSDFLPFSRPAMGDEEINAACAVLRSGWITTGPRNQELEQAFCDRFGAQHAIAVSSATGGMHVTLMALGIGPGDEVITPSQTWVSTINLITLLGAKPVFVDVDRETLMTDASRIEAAITPDTRAIIPVHYAGAPPGSGSYLCAGQETWHRRGGGCRPCGRHSLSRSLDRRPGHRHLLLSRHKESHLCRGRHGGNG